MLHAVKMLFVCCTYNAFLVYAFHLCSFCVHNQVLCINIYTRVNKLYTYYNKLLPTTGRKFVALIRLSREMENMLMLFLFLFCVTLRQYTRYLVRYEIRQAMNLFRILCSNYRKSDYIRHLIGYFIYFRRFLLLFQTFSLLFLDISDFRPTIDEHIRQLSLMDTAWCGM